MDIPRKSAARKRLLKRLVFGTLLVVAVGLITFGVARLKPAAPSVEASTVLTDTVKRGSMLRQVRGLGTLVPEDIRLIPARNEGRVEAIPLKPGVAVKADTVLIKLSNPQLEQTAMEAGSQLQASEADYASLKVRLERQVLDQKAAAATVQSDFSQAKMQAEVNETLYKQGLLAEILWRTSKVKAEELATRNEIELKRLSIFAEEVKTQLAAQQAQLDQRRALYQLRRNEVEALTVRAGTSGVLQAVEVQVGQQVTSGTNLARVVDPTRLKAELKINETQVKDLLIGQTVSIDTRNGLIPGKVSRIDPAAQNGTFTIDVSLEGALPNGARPNLTVDGTVEIERLENILYVGRPVQGKDHSKISLFKLEEGGKSAVRTSVTLGRSSVSTIEIVDGLHEGDKVILSDTAAYDNTEYLRLN
ncbi:MAG: HlyD family efflux transporter periplasmic adaptor subunit [Acidobacteria bacterium]|nr:HlyD family efflux transporter periplasmic adaptor subunit [Acidobacteriota bacterium]